jgi:hypothetical protein
MVSPSAKFFDTKLNWPPFPYPGLRPFRFGSDVDESLIFHGRDQQRDELVERLDRSQFVAVVGPSGCGKSSMVKAGVIPLLRAGLLTNAGSEWLPLEMRPGSDPIGNLVAALAGLRIRGEEVAGARLEEVKKILQTRRNPLWAITESLVGHHQSQEQSSNAPRLLLLIDQFEEIFFGLAREEAVDQFVQQLIQFFRNPHGQLYIMLTMRTDFIDRCANYPGLAEILNETQYITPVLRDGALREAIVDPAEAYGGTVDEELVAAILNDMGTGMGYDADRLPLMQHALLWMWQRACEAAELPAPPTPANLPGDDQRRPRLTLKLYHDNGGLSGILNLHADHLLNRVTAGQEDKHRMRVAQAALSRLGERDSNGRYKRTFAHASEVCAFAACRQEELEEILAPFVDASASFIEERPDSERREPLIDVSHESLIRQWESLRGWVDEEAKKLEAFKEVLRRADDKADYPTEKRLNALESNWAEYRPNDAWARRYSYKGGEVSKCKSFLDESRDRIDRGRKFRRYAWAGGALIVGAIIGGGVLGGYQYYEAQNELVKDAKVLFKGQLDKFWLEREPKETLNYAAAFIEPLLGDNAALPDFVKDPLTPALDALVRMSWAKTTPLFRGQQVRQLIVAGHGGEEKGYAALAAVRANGLDFYRRESDGKWDEEKKKEIKFEKEEFRGMAIYQRGNRLAMFLGSKLYVGSPDELAERRGKSFEYPSLADGAKNDPKDEVSFSWMASCSLDDKVFWAVDRQEGTLWRLTTGDDGGKFVVSGQKYAGPGKIRGRSIEPSKGHLAVMDENNEIWIGPCDKELQKFDARVGGIRDIEFTEDELLGVAKTDDTIRYYRQDDGNWRRQNEKEREIPAGATFQAFADGFRVWVVASPLEGKVRRYRLWDSKENKYEEDSDVILPPQKADDKTTAIGTSLWFATVKDTDTPQVHGVIAKKVIGPEGLAVAAILTRTDLPNAKQQTTRDSEDILDRLGKKKGELGIKGEIGAYRKQERKMKCDNVFTTLVDALEQGIDDAGEGADEGRKVAASLRQQCLGAGNGLPQQWQAAYRTLLDFAPKNEFYKEKLPTEVIVAALGPAVAGDPIGLRLIALDAYRRDHWFAAQRLLLRAMREGQPIPLAFVAISRNELKGGDKKEPGGTMSRQAIPAVLERAEGAFADGRLYELRGHQSEANGDWEKAVASYSSAFDEYVDTGDYISARAVANRRNRLISKLKGIEDLVGIWRSLPHGAARPGPVAPTATTARAAAQLPLSEGLDKLAAMESDPAVRHTLEEAFADYRRSIAK